MKKIRYVLFVLWVLFSVPSNAQVSVEIGLPHVNIGINLPVYPELVVVPGYPAYYAPQLDANFFFYDGDYWIYQDDNWYQSTWYNGPWWIVEPEFVPVFVLRIPVYYYRRPPAYFHGWRNDAPPRWGDHWGHDWERHRSGWDQWDHNARHKLAPLPVYQRQYSGERYPQQVDQQHELHNKHYRYQTRDPVMQQRHQEQSGQRAPTQQENKRAPEERGSMQKDIRRSTPRQQDDSNFPRTQSPQRGGVIEQGSTQGSPRQERPPVQYRRQQSQPDTDQRERQMQRSQDRETRQQDRETSRETRRGQGQDNERGRDR
jgi:hypothetical protein